MQARRIAVLLSIFQQRLSVTGFTYILLLFFTKTVKRGSEKKIVFWHKSFHLNVWRD